MSVQHFVLCLTALITDIRSLQYRISQNTSLTFGNVNNISSNGSSYVIIPKEVLAELGAQGYL